MEECLITCLFEVIVPSVSPENIEKTCPNLIKVPTEYHNLKEVFNKIKVTSLPPHRSYDCAIDLIPGTTPPRGSLYSLSRPEHTITHNYIKESLQAGIIRPSASPAGAGFVFVGKKDGSLRPYIDYRALNKITIKPIASYVYSVRPHPRCHRIL